ncbi:DNA phosphorothioation-dependent restriction protein DptF [Bacillus infantis]|uniref:DNA phosphorothioation-dependent restriction protein DptF n=1 Tax=Bacillus infantis TaxID=324767 RepID=UPI002003E1FF|nr:DNA phosphorothioation-dependent restriction protein DptF [Bacillus infantis]MCK6207699.1 DNA phosphorothioation-dependent restriction protein DptF [Bacillus infantis]
MATFLGFLDNINPVAAKNAKKMEELLYEDPGSSIVKARLFAEAILNEVFKLEKIDAPYVSSLFEKISYLTREGYIKRAVQHSFDTIRLSGNKAAHDGDFSDISEAFKLHKEMYNVGVWFYEVYSSEEIKIPAYDTPKPPRKEENIEELVRKQVLDLLGSNYMGEAQVEKSVEGISFKNTIQPEEVVNTGDVSLLKKDLPNGESYLLRELKRLKDSSQEAIENASQFSSFKDYLHVDRRIQLDLEHILEEQSVKNSGNLILLCGSVGDGKSHLLAYLKKKKPHLIGKYTIFNDATESFSPNKNAMETLEEVLNSFSDQNIEQSTEKVILAINMGVLHNFINTRHENYSYQQLKQFVEKSDIFSQNITTFYSEGSFDLLSFGDYHSYELAENGPTSTFFSTLMKKVFSDAEDNPFYAAMKEDEMHGVRTIVHENFQLMQNEFVQRQIVQLVIQTIVKSKLVISARTFLNFIADILIPDEVKNINLVTEFETLKDSLPTLLFNRRERSVLLNALNEVDPIHNRSIFIDQVVIDLNTLSDWEGLINKNIQHSTPIKWLKPFISSENLSDYSFNLFFESFIRLAYLTNEDFASNLTDSSYREFTKNLFYFNVGEKRKIKGFYDEIKKAIFNWKGSPKRGYIYLNKPDEKFRLAQKLNLRPTIEHLSTRTEEQLDSFKSSILLAYHGGDSDHKIYLDIDYQLYQLLVKVQQGYRPNKKDEEDAIKFVEFIDKIMAFGEKKNELLIHYPNDKKYYTIKKDDFGSFVFERE